MPTPEEVELAELIAGRVAYVERDSLLQFRQRGCDAAIKAARAFTGRHKIAKFEGAYHGLYDYARSQRRSNPDDWGDADAPARSREMGTPPSVASDVVVFAVEPSRSLPQIN